MRAVGLVAICLLATAQGQQSSERVNLETSKPFRYDSATDTVQGEAILARWREYQMEASRLLGYPRKAEYRFFEGVRLYSENLLAQGKELTLYPRARRWTLLDGRAELKPAFLENRLLSSLYLYGERLESVENRVHAEQCTATTCGIDRPHFHWSAETLDATAGDRAILRNVRLTILGRTVLSIPYVAVPLRESDTSPLPDAGYTEEEGFYIRYAIAYLLVQGALGNARFDLMQKRGLGINVQQSYSRGDLNLYLLRDLRQRADTLTGRWQHGQRLGALQTRWNAEYRRNSYQLFRDNTAWSWRTDWTLPSRTGQSRLSFAESRNRTGAFENANRTLALQDNRTLGRLQSNLSGEYLEFENQSGARRTGSRQWNLRANLRYELKRETNLQLDFDRLVPVGETRGFGGLERLPELSLSASARSLGLPLPDSQLRLSVGRFAEGFQTRITRERYAFEWQGRSGGFAREAQKRPATLWNYRFRQTFYSDDTAQYLLQSNLEQQLPLSKRFRLNLRWNYLRPYGYSPLGLDRTGIYNLLSSELQWRLGGGWSLAAQTSYDLQASKKGRDPWSLLNMNLEYQPAEWLRWRTQLSYDPNRERWRSLQTDLQWRFGDSRLAFAARYDPERARWGSVFLRVDALKWGRSRISFLTQYNGYLNRFESRQALWMYDLHCAELEVRYVDNPFGFRRDTGLQIFLRLKALPSLSRFGYGQFGQPVGTIGSEF